MAIRFRPQAFLQPVSLLKYRSLLERAQWWPPEQLRAYQQRRLRVVLRHAVRDVPYYRDVFTRAHLKPGDIDDVEALRLLPLLTKDDIRTRSRDLVAARPNRFRPAAVSTTGSTSLPVTVLLDRHTNALEFAFYWRHWGWFGYRLGDRFAQLSWSEFSDSASTSVRIEAGTGRLLLNALYASSDRAADFAAAMRAHGARFLKGHPSALLHFALFVRRGRLAVPPLRAVFSTGEVLERTMRSAIQDIFQAPVADAYGQMERVVAACECPDGRMHITPEYGCWDTMDEGVDPVSGRRLARIVGSGLHNLSMPLIRYDTGDLAEADERSAPCPCGRSLPTVGRLHGRSVDAIVTPDGRVVTVASIVFNDATAILQGQLVQEEAGALLVRVLPAPEFRSEDERRLIDAVRRLVGPDMTIDIDRVESPAAFQPAGRKHRPVVSTLYQRIVAAGQPLP